MFVDCVCLHPVLSQSAVWKHFIECTDEKMWKMGKRKAEKDALVGANYFACLQVPEKVIDPFDLYVLFSSSKCMVKLLWFCIYRERQTENAGRFITSMDLAVKNLMITSVDQTKKCQAQYKREYQKIGQTFHMLGTAFDLDNTTGLYSCEFLVSRILIYFFAIRESHESNQNDWGCIQQHRKDVRRAA